MDEGVSRFHPFDPDSGLIPEIAEFGPLIERSGGRCIILVGVPGVETRYWCARAAAALVTSWSAQGARIVLADASLSQPVLHEVLDLPNSEGVTDVMVNGAQLRGVSRRVGSPGFLFISAGTQTADVANVMASSAWDVVIKALAIADLTLVVYAPADLRGLDALLARSTSVVLLGGDLKKADEAIQTLGLSEAAQLGPGVPSRGTDSAEATEAIEATEVTKVADMGEAPRSDAPRARAVDGKRAHSRRVSAWKPAAVGLLVLAGWAGSRALFGGATDSLENPEERDDPPVPFVAPPPETPQAYSLSLAAFQDGEVAVRQAEGLAGRRTDLLFTTVPVLVSGRVFHRILAGPATDSAAAEELRTSLGETLSDEDSSVWVVRATPLAFDLGDYGSREAADRKAEELAVTGLAPYVFEVGPPDGLSFRVYAGAYADSAEASVVHEQFMEPGEELLQLVRRVGRYVARP